MGHPIECKWSSCTKSYYCTSGCKSFIVAQFLSNFNYWGNIDDTTQYYHYIGKNLVIMLWAWPKFQSANFEGLNDFQAHHVCSIESIFFQALLLICRLLMHSVHDSRFDSSLLLLGVQGFFWTNRGGASLVWRSPIMDHWVIFMHATRL